MSAKVSPYYSNEKEKTDLIAAIKDFKFDAPRATPKLVVMIAGEENAGKTHLACTMSEVGPVYLVDTEYRADTVINKFTSKDRDIKFKVVRTWKELVVAVKYFIKYMPPGTIVIDSASDMQTFAEIDYLHKTMMEKIYPITNWAEIWAMCNALVDDIKFSHHGLVVTTRVKEKYMNDKGTGIMIPRIYDPLKYKCDFGIQFSKDKKEGWLFKNGEDNRFLHLPIPKDMSLPKVIDYIVAESKKEQHA